MLLEEEIKSLQEDVRDEDGIRGEKGWTDASNQSEAKFMQEEKARGEAGTSFQWDLTHIHVKSSLQHATLCYRSFLPADPDVARCLLLFPKGRLRVAEEMIGRGRTLEAVVLVLALFCAYTGCQNLSLSRLEMCCLSRRLQLWCLLIAALLTLLLYAKEPAHV